MKLKTLIATNAPAGQPQLKMRSMPANEEETDASAVHTEGTAEPTCTGQKHQQQKENSPAPISVQHRCLCMLQAHCLQLVQRCALPAAALRTQC